MKCVCKCLGIIAVLITKLRVLYVFAVVARELFGTRTSDHWSVNYVSIPPSPFYFIFYFKLTSW